MIDLIPIFVGRVSLEANCVWFGGGWDISPYVSHWRFTGFSGMGFSQISPTLLESVFYSVGFVNHAKKKKNPPSEKNNKNSKNHLGSNNVHHSKKNKKHDQRNWFDQ